MFLNILWLIIQVLITNRILKKKNIYFLPPWILINFNTLAFITIFVYAPPGIFSGQDDINSNFWYNLLILIVLTARSVIDYYVGWESIYNRIPMKKPEEIVKIASYLLDKKKINPTESNKLNVAAKDLYLRSLPKEG